MADKIFSIAKYYRVITDQLLARSALSDSIFQHPDLIGRPLEIVVRDFLRSIFPPQIGIIMGQMVSTKGYYSPQCDIIFYRPTYGSIVGTSEDGNALVRADSIVGVIEVKKTINGTNIDRIHDHCKELHNHCTHAGKSQNWFHLAMGFISNDSKDAIISNLNKKHHQLESTMNLLVLNVPRSAEELKELYRKMPGYNEKNGRDTVTAEALHELASTIQSANSMLFTRGESSYTVKVSTNPALLDFVMDLEARLKQYGSSANWNLSDFLEGRGVDTENLSAAELTNAEIGKESYEEDQAR